MPGKHGMTKNYKGMPKRTKAEAKADAIKGGFDKATAEEVFAKMKKGMPKNYDGMKKNFAMKNKMLSDSAKNGIPMSKNYGGMPKKPTKSIDTSSLGENVTNDPKYSKAKKEGKTVYKSKTGQITTTQGMPKNRKLKKTDKKIKKNQTKEIKERLSKLSTEELMEMKRNKENGLPKMKKTPTLPPKKMKVRESYYGQIGPSKPDEKMNRRYS